MKGYKLKLILFMGLFAVLCVKGEELYSAHRSFAMSPHDRPQESAPANWAPLKDPSEEFKGVSPRPDLAVSLPMVKNGTKVKKSGSQAKTSGALHKAGPKKPAKKS